jgi:ankyrin repeat protein
VLEFYLKKGLDPNLYDSWKKYTPLFSCKYDFEVVKLLLENGANPNHLDTFGYTFLMYGTNIEVLKLAVEFSYDLTLENENGNALLHSLFNNNYNINEQHLNEQTKILNYLLENNIIDLNKFNEKNLTILQYAGIYGDLTIETLKLLINHGANPNLETKRENWFRLWDDEPTILPIGMTLKDVFEKKKEILISQNQRGLVSEEIYFEKGMRYFQNILDVLKN